jgi:hypothetical protein
MVSYCINTTGTGTDHVALLLKFTDELLPYFLAVITVSIFVGRLPAASLIHIVIYAITQPLQDLQCIPGGLGPEFVHMAGNE